MDYYAASLREPGEKLNIDGLMIKGVHDEKASDVVIMVLSTDKRDGKRNDKVIRTAERMIYKVKATELKTAFDSFFCRFKRAGFLPVKGTPDITVLVLKGINYFIMNRGENKVMRVGRLGAEDMSREAVFCEKGGYYFSEGRLSEGSTLVAANKAFYERETSFDIHKRLCPQMCVDQESMQSNMEYLRDLLWSRGEEKPVTAAAVCVR